MNAETKLDDLDRALANAAARTSHPRRPTPLRPLSWSSRLRRLWDRHRAWIKIAIYGSGVVFLLTQGQYRNPFVFLLFLLPLWLKDHRDQRQQAEALESDEDFLKAERERVEKRHGREVFTLVLMLVFAALMGVAAIFGKHPLAAGVVSVLVLAWVALRWFLFMPGLKRELVDLGGDADGGKLVHVLTACLVVLYVPALPFLISWWALKGISRRLRGLPPDDDQDDDQDDADANASGKDGHEPRAGGRS